MAAIIKGTVFNDLNNNGILDPGEPGIAKVYMVITNPNGSCTAVQTDASGVYTFSDLTVAGNYTIYETVVDSGAARLPTSFGQPTGFTNSSTFRTQTINVTQDEIDNNSTIDGENYGHGIQQDAFTCSSFGYQTFSNPNQPGFSLARINLVTGQLTIIKENIGIAINAIGYNILDNYIYGMEGTTRNLVRLAADGSVTNLGPIPNLPVPPVTYNVGTIDDQGHMFIMQQGTGTYYVIDVDQNSPTFGRLLDPTAGYILDTAPFGTSLVYPPTNTINITDWSYSPIDGQLYSVKFSDPGPSVVVRINPTTGVVTELTTTGIPGGSHYGASFMDADGNFYVINNDTGRVYRVQISGNTATGQYFSQSSPATANDGAACIGASIELDFGDAPDKTSGNGPDDYRTLLANDGPRHQIINELTLGTQVTAEGDAYANLTTNATGDDILQGIQDDGVTFPLTPLLISDTSYSLDVDVVNNTGSPANVYGWIDFSRGGLFQRNEAAPVVVVPSAPGVQEVTLNFTVPAGITLTPGHTFVRVRVTTDELINQNPSPIDEDTRSIGPASDGEVEDYYLEIIEKADLSVVKTASSEVLTTGDVLTYRLVVSNSGPTDAREVTLTDEVPSEILNPEFSIDGGITWNPWVSPYNIGTMEVGESINILIRGTISETALGIVNNTAIVDSPTPDPDPTNNESTVIVEVKVAELDVIKHVDKDIALVGDNLIYTMSIENKGNVDADNVVFKDEIPPETSFVAGSVSINGVPDIGANPESGFDIGTIAPGETVLVSFTVKIESRPEPPEILNTAVVDYDYVIDPDRPPIDKSTESNEVITIVEIVKVGVLKSADKTFALKGDIITYTVIINNNSTIPAYDIVFTDPIPEGTSFVPSSVTVNGSPVSGDPSTGIDLGVLDPGESVRVSFKVQVEFIPCPAIIVNKAFVVFNYVLGSNRIEETVESNNAITNLAITSFKQLSKEEYVKIPAQKPDAEEILNTLVDIEIINTKVIKTPVSTSLEGQKLTGFKLIVEGMLNQKVEYIACDKEQSVHAAHFRVPFSTFIVLPENYVEGTNVEVEAIVEDIYSQLIDKRTVFKNITFMILAKFAL